MTAPCSWPSTRRPSPAQTRRLVEQERIEALAICFLHAHVDDRHERRTREIAQALYPSLHISHSADVFPYPREFERWTTTCANAYSQPLVDRYLSRLETGLAEGGFRGRLWIMASSGGLMGLDMARRYPVKLLESGPAAGVLVAARIGTAVAGGDLLSFDLGGTTAKGALVRKGRPFRAYAFEAAHAYEYRSGSGLPLQIPVLDMTEIGTGGGSLVGPDALGRLRVGPRSAGAEPGAGLLWPWRQDRDPDRRQSPARLPPSRQLPRRHDDARSRECPAGLWRADRRATRRRCAARGLGRA